jgi:hypothetical protein
MSSWSDLSLFDVDKVAPKPETEAQRKERIARERRAVNDGQWIALRQVKGLADYAHIVDFRNRTEGLVVTRCDQRGSEVTIPHGTVVYPCPECWDRTPEAHTTERV